MRVSKDKNDAAYDARERKVYLNDQEFTGDWITADEFRRAIVLADGRALFGNVHIERLPKLIDVTTIHDDQKVSVECSEQETDNQKALVELEVKYREAIALPEDSKTLADCDARFAYSENLPKNPIELPSITETPKYGFAMGDRAKFKERK